MDDAANAKEPVSDAFEIGESSRNSTDCTAMASSDSERRLHSVSGKHVQDPEPEPEQEQTFNKDYRFWMIMVTLAFAVMLVSLESTVVITSLPTIVAELEVGGNYIWVTNVFSLQGA